MTTATTATFPGLTAGTWAIDPVHSTVGFTVRHLVVSKVRGNFTNFSGAVTVAEDGTAAVSAEIAVDSIDTRNSDRDVHLKSADFFEAEKFPTASFTSTGIRSTGKGFVVDGEFTLRGVTKPVELELEFNGVNPGMGNGPAAAHRSHGPGGDARRRPCHRPARAGRADHGAARGRRHVRRPAGAGVRVGAAQLRREGRRPGP